MMLRESVGSSRARYVAPALNGCESAQLLVLVIAAALVPNRAAIGLLAAIGCAFTFGYVAQACGGMVVGLAGLDECLRALPMLAAVQGLRLFLAWRLTREALPAHHTLPQFHLAELMEWTTSICAALGSIALFGLYFPGAFDRSTTVAFLLYFAQCLLLGVPVALANLSPRPPNGQTVMALALWCALVAVACFLTEWFLYRNRVTVWTLLVMASRGTVPFLAVFLPVLVGNALIIRRLGYRWRNPPSASALKMPRRT
jgi:hypothetical protein